MARILPHSRAPSLRVFFFLPVAACSATSFVGARYRCTVCPDDFDFCEVCRWNEPHFDGTHAFEKIGHAAWDMGRTPRDLMAALDGAQVRVKGESKILYVPPPPKCCCSVM